MPLRNRIGFLGSGLAINGIIKSYQVATGENISAGSFVEYSNGFVKSFGTQISGVAKTSGSAGEMIDVWVPIGGSGSTDGGGSGDVTPSYAANFADNSWSDIISACQNNQVPSTWAVGNSKTMTINGTDYQIDIIGKNHDTYSSGGTAPLTFQLHDCYNTQYPMYSVTPNLPIWTNTTLRKTTLSNILNQMPTEVKSAVKEVNKAIVYNGTNYTAQDKLFLLSEQEVFGNTNIGYGQEGTQYNYYTTNISSKTGKKVNGSNVNWWTRTHSKSDSGFFACAIAYNSRIANGAGTSHGISFAFCF